MSCFIDEIHRLAPSVEEFIYPAMEDFKVDFVVDKGAFARVINVPLKKFTLVGATTRAGLTGAATSAAICAARCSLTGTWRSSSCCCWPGATAACWRATTRWPTSARSRSPHWPGWRRRCWWRCTSRSWGRARWRPGSPRARWCGSTSCCRWCCPRDPAWLLAGPLGQDWLAPDRLLGLGEWSRLGRAVVLSLAVNVAVIAWVAGTRYGRAAGAAGVGDVGMAELRALAVRFLPPERVEHLFAHGAGARAGRRHAHGRGGARTGGGDRRGLRAAAAGGGASAGIAAISIPSPPSSARRRRTCASTSACWRPRWRT